MDALSAVGNLVVGGKARGTSDRPAHIMPLGMREALTVRAELVRELRPYLDRNKLRQQAQPADQAQVAPAAKKNTTPRADASESQSLSKKAKRRQRCLPPKYDSTPTAASSAQQWNVTFRTAEGCDYQVAVLVQLASMAHSDVLFAVVTRDTFDDFSCTCMDTSFQSDDDPSKACIHVHIFRYADCHRSGKLAAIAAVEPELASGVSMDQEMGMGSEKAGGEDMDEDMEHDIVMTEAGAEANMQPEGESAFEERGEPMSEIEASPDFELETEPEQDDVTVDTGTASSGGEMAPEGNSHGTVDTLMTPVHGASGTDSSTDDATSLPRFFCERLETNLSLRVQHHDSLLSVFSGTGRCTVLRLTRTRTIKCETCKGSTCNHAVFWQQPSPTQSMDGKEKKKRKPLVSSFDISAGDVGEYQCDDARHFISRYAPALFPDVLQSKSGRVPLLSTGDDTQIHHWRSYNQTQKKPMPLRGIEQQCKCGLDPERLRVYVLGNSTASVVEVNYCPNKECKNRVYGNSPDCGVDEEFDFYIGTVATPKLPTPAVTWAYGITMYAVRTLLHELNKNERSVKGTYGSLEQSLLKVPKPPNIDGDGANGLHSEERFLWQLLLEVIGIPEHALKAAWYPT
jgi:hypothetical protein